MIEMNIRNRLELSRNAAMVSGIFCVAVALLLLLNYWQVSRYDPLESKAMEVLVQRLAENPDDDALKNDIRNLDLLARKAYFNSRWQVTTGSYLLLFGAVVFALALRVYHSLKSKIELPDQKQENELASRILAQRWVILSGAGLLALALVASLASVDHLKSFGTGDSSPEGEASVAADPGIEVIEVGEEPVLVTADTSGVNGADTTQVAVLPGAAEGTPGTGDSSAVKEIVFPDAGQLRANHPPSGGPWPMASAAAATSPSILTAPPERTSSGR